MSGDGKLLLVEPVGGIAGDMFVAAALDLGVSLEALEAAVRPLGLPGWRFEVRRVERHAIGATHVDVVLEQPDGAHDRAWSEIRALIEESALAPGIKAKALAAFEVLAVAEGRIHGVPPEHVHFHEVGAVDSIVDFVAAAAALELLGSPRCFSLAPPLGSGTVRSRHGVIPVPAPATLDLLRGRPVRFEGMGETTTPTGAALLAALTEPGAPPEFIPERVGYGAGTRDSRDRANVVRLTLGRSGAGSRPTRWVLEVNLDDASPQLFARLFERCLEAGALDVWSAPVLMKKGRPAQLLGLIVDEPKRAAVEQVVFEESTTLGIRRHAVERTELTRRFVTVETGYGPVRIKLGEREGALLNAAPEYEDVLTCARAHGVPVKEVASAAISAWRRGAS